MKKIFALLIVLMAGPNLALAAENRFFGYYLTNKSIPDIAHHATMAQVWAHYIDEKEAIKTIFEELNDAKKHRIKAMVDVPSFLFKQVHPSPTNAPIFGAGQYLEVRPGSDKLWDTFVKKLVKDGYLIPGNPAASTVAAFYIIDEPTTSGLKDTKSGAAHPELVKALRVIRNNPLSKDVPLATIINFTNSRNGSLFKQGVKLFDWVGSLHYGVNADTYIGIVNNTLSKYLLPNQKLFLVPRAYVKWSSPDLPSTNPQSPSKIEAALWANDKIIGILPFVWKSVPGLLKGIDKDPILQKQYTPIGHRIKKRNSASSIINTANYLLQQE